MSSIFADQYRLRIWAPNGGGGGELRGLSQWVQLYTGAQINFGDLTPYLTYVVTLHDLSILLTCAGCLPGPECAARLPFRGLHRVHGQQEWLSLVYFSNFALQIQICRARPVWGKGFWENLFLHMLPGYAYCGFPLLFFVIKIVAIEYYIFTWYIFVFSNGCSFKIMTNCWCLSKRKPP